MTQRIGLLVVHGIGEQKRFETAAAMARSLAQTLKAHGAAVSVIDRSGALDAGKLDCPSPLADDAPYRIVLGPADGDASLHIHEVWWADIGADKGVLETIGFWMWALGQWAAGFITFTHFEDGHSNTDRLMTPPQFPRTLRARIKAALTRPFLFLWGLGAFLTFFSWSALKWLFSWLSSYIGSPSIINEYADRVRVYTEAVKPDGGSLVDLGMPWRATIRRRMVAELVAMAERGYDRWYVLGHSQGAVLAYNGVEETEWTLPNYLQKAHFDRLKAHLRTDQPYTPNPRHPPDLEKMMPARPVWLSKNDGVSREGLFRNFRGLVTYGAPLNKFAALWERIVFLNPQPHVFSGASWVNLWDGYDPIGARLDAFSGSVLRKGGPANLHVRAGWFFLLAHIAYFQPNRPETRALLRALMGGATGLDEAFAALPDAGGAHGPRRAVATLQALGLLALLSGGAGFLAYSAKSLIGAAFEKISNAVDGWPRLHNVALGVKAAGDWLTSAVALGVGDHWWSPIYFVWCVAIMTVLSCGVWRRISETRLDAAHKKLSAARANSPSRGSGRETAASAPPPSANR